MNKRKKNYSLQTIKIKSKWEGEIYIPKYLFDQFSIPSKKNGELWINRIKAGRAYRGFKHLYEKVTEKGEKLVLSDEQSKREKGYCWINMKDYQAKGQSVFLSLYREVGLEVAGSYLHGNFPNNYEHIEEQKKLSSKKFEDVIKQSEGSEKKESAVIKQASKIIENSIHKKDYSLLKKKIKELEELQKQSNIGFYIAMMGEFKERLLDPSKYKETSGKSHWQGRLVKNNRIFGNLYNKPIEKSSINISGQMPDYIFPTLNGFFDVIEIKRPSHNIIKYDVNHKCYRRSDETNKAIAQVLHYLNEIDRNFYALKDRYEKLKINFTKPRGYVVIGLNYDTKEEKEIWNKDRFEGFRLLNSGLNNIEVITYSDLYKRGIKIIELYNNSIE